MSPGEVDRPSGGQQLTQHERQDTAVLVVIHFDRRVDAQQDLHLLRVAVLAMDHQRDILLRLDVGRQTFDPGSDYTTWNLGGTYALTDKLGLDLRYYDNNLKGYDDAFVVSLKAAF